MAGHKQQNQWDAVSCESVLSPLTTTSPDIFPQPFDICPRHRVLQAGADPRALRGCSAWAAQPLPAASREGNELNCTVMAGELLGTAASTWASKLVGNCLEKKTDIPAVWRTSFLKIAKHSHKQIRPDWGSWGLSVMSGFCLCLTCKQLLVPAET